MSLNIRPATVADATVIRDMIWQLAAYHGDRAETTNDFFLRYAFALPQVYGFFLLETAGQPCAFAKYNIFTDFAKAHKQMDMDMLWVDEAARGRGYGRALIRYVAAFALAQGCTSFRITARKSNEVAAKLYRTLGLQELDKGDSWRFVGDEPQLRKLAA